MLMLGGLRVCGCCEQALQCVLYPADWFFATRSRLHLADGSAPGSVASLVYGHDATQVEGRRTISISESCKEVMQFEQMSLVAAARNLKP